jgi:hypothetical protein
MSKGKVNLIETTILFVNTILGLVLERAVFGHGKPLDKRANQQLKERFSGTKLR